MALKICHTGDWHLGQTLYRRDREAEHAAFLRWLVDQLERQRVDALVVAGDVFDSGNPPGSALALFYGFLASVRARLPALAVVVVAGNHDSPARLAAPDPLVRGLGVSIVGGVPYDGGVLQPERMVIPIERDGERLGQVVAVPFLRAADLPPVREDEADPQARGARRVYEAAVARARASRRSPDEPIVVTGHFAAAGARMTLESERRLALGLDGTLPIDVVDTDGVAYVALGHLHLAQRVPAAVEARYAGSPLPLSFAERGFAHEVRIVTVEGSRARSESLRVPPFRSLVRIPAEGGLDRAGIVAALAAYTERASEDDERTWPWVEVRALARVDERDVVESIEAAAATKALHLVHVAVERPDVAEGLSDEARAIASLDVRELLVARWSVEHDEAPGAAVLEALAEATSEARASLEQRRTRAVELEGERTLALAPLVAARRPEMD